MATGISSGRWPARLWLIRHGESAGNVARDQALANGLSYIEIAGRDVDVPLSERGIRQSEALRDWFAARDPNYAPQVVLCSPYARARETASIICGQLRFGNERIVPLADERLREKEFGVLDRLTSIGIAERHPEQVEFRKTLGKFYFRPPGGESWCDVILRLRSALDTLALHYTQKRVLIVTHQVVVLCFRYLIEKLDEAQILGIDLQGDVANCSVTEYTFASSDDADEVEPRLVQFNSIAALLREQAPVTAKRDAPEKPRP